MGTDIISINIFLQFIRWIPVSLDEAARLDGASSLRIYWPGHPAAAQAGRSRRSSSSRASAIYNDFYTPFLYMPSDNLGTIISTSLY